MKTLSAAMTAHINRQTTTLATLVRVTLTDGTVLRFTDHDRDVTFGGNSYSATDGVGRSAVKNSSDLSIDNLDVEGLLAVLVTIDDVRQGRFDFAAVRVSLVNWQDPDLHGEIVLREGTLGQVQLRDQAYQAEMRGKLQTLTRRRGRVAEPACPVDLFSPLKDTLTGDSGCGLLAANFLETSEVASVTDRRQFTGPVQLTIRPDPDESTVERDDVQQSADDEFTILPDGPRDGTPLRPFEISTAQQLEDIADNLYAHYVLVSDIDMSAHGLFATIPTFFGTLDGRGFEIRDIDLDHSAAPQAAAIFQNVSFGATVRRVGVVNATVRSSGGFRKAPLAANVTDGGRVIDCYAIGGTVTTDGDLAGGLVGRIGDGSIVRRCYAAVEMVGVIGANSGAFATDRQSSGTEEFTYFDEDAAGTSVAGNNVNATALTGANAVLQASYSGFDFDDVWAMGSGSFTGTTTFLDTNPDTMLRTGSWYTSGFRAHMVLTVSGSNSNDGTYTVRVVPFSTAPGTMTLDAAEALVVEVATANVTTTGVGHPRLMDPGRC